MYCFVLRRNRNYFIELFSQAIVVKQDALNSGKYAKTFHTFEPYCEGQLFCSYSSLSLTKSLCFEFCITY